MFLILQNYQDPAEPQVFTFNAADAINVANNPDINDVNTGWGDNNQIVANSEELELVGGWGDANNDNAVEQDNNWENQNDEPAEAAPTNDWADNGWGGTDSEFFYVKRI